MKTWEEIELSIRRAILKAGTNTQVIFAYPQSPRPSLPYTAIEVVSWGAVINDWFKTDPHSGVTKQYGIRELNVRIHWYGTNAYFEGALCASRLEQLPVRWEMSPDNTMSILRTDDIVLVSDLIENSYEPRAEMNMVLSVALMDGTVDEDVGYFDDIEPILWTNKPH